MKIGVCVSILILMVQLPPTVDGGRRHSSLRIHKGENVSSKDYPFVMVLVQVQEVSRESLEFGRTCTCSLIQPEWILIAGHCMHTALKIYGLPATILISRIIYGDLTIPLKNTTFVKKIKEVYIHPEYKENMQVGILSNDIALLKTECFSKIQPVKISALDFKSLIGNSVKYLGAGVTYSIVNLMRKEVKLMGEIDSKDQTRPLQLGEAVVVKCELTNPHNYPEICLAPKCSKSDQYSLFGDSGGPVLFKNKIIGVCSSGDVGAAEFVGTVRSNSRSMFLMYTPISPYLEWIHHVVTVVPKHDCETKKN